jgi:hypothetical protein
MVLSKKYDKGQGVQTMPDPWLQLTRPLAILILRQFGKNITALTGIKALQINTRIQSVCKWWNKTIKAAQTIQQKGTLRLITWFRLAETRMIAMFS